MKKKYTIIILATILSSVFWTPLLIYLTRPVPMVDWLVCRGVVTNNATQPLFNATIVIYTDEGNMQKGFTNKSGQFIVYNPFPTNRTLPVICFAYKQGYLDVVRQALLPANLAIVGTDTDAHAELWGYINFDISMEPTPGGV